MELTLIVLFVLTALLLNLVIILQPGKGSGMGAIGGGGGSGGGAAGSMFGARGAVPFLSKLTAWLAAIFMALSLGLARVSLDKSAVAVSALAPPTEEGAAAGGDDENTDGTKPAEGDEAKPAAAAPGAARRLGSASRPAPEAEGHDQQGQMREERDQGVHRLNPIRGGSRGSS